MKRWMLVVIAVSIIAITVFAWAWSRSVVHVRPSAPTIDSTPLNLAAYPSSFSLDVTLPLATVQETISAQIPPTLSGTQSIDIGDPVREERVEFSFSRGPIEVSGSGDQLKVALPLSGSASLKGCVEAIFVCVDFSETANVAGTVTATVSNVRLDPSWNLQANTQINVDVSEARLDLIGDLIPISLRGELTKLINNELPDVVAKIQTELLPSLRVREQVEAAWQELNSIVQLSDQPPVWLRFTPTGIFLQPIAVVDEAITTSFGIVTSVQTFVSVQPEALPLPPLPALGNETLAKGFNLQIPIISTTDFLQSEGKACCLGQSFELGEGVNLTPTSFNLQGDNGKLYADLGFKARGSNVFTRADGNLYLVASPSWNPDTHILTVRGLEFEAATENLLLEAAGWLLQPVLNRELEKLLVFDLAKEIEEGRIKANEELRNIKLPENLQAEVTIEELEVEDVLFDNNQVVVVVSATGRARAVLSGF